MAPKAGGGATAVGVVGLGSASHPCWMTPTTVTTALSAARRTVDGMILCWLAGIEVTRCESPAETVDAASQVLGLSERQGWRQHSAETVRDPNDLGIAGSAEVETTQRALAERASLGHHA